MESNEISQFQDKIMQFMSRLRIFAIGFVLSVLLIFYSILELPGYQVVFILIVGIIYILMFTWHRRWKKQFQEVERQINIRDKKWFSSFERILVEKDLLELETQWGSLLGVQRDALQFRYLQHMVNQIENRSLGRVAGNIQDIILRIMVGLSIEEDEVRFLEIGSLFGVNAIIVYSLLSLFKDKVHITLLDPLDGYYSSGKLDLTGLPIDRKTLDRNLERNDIPAEDYTVIQELSTASTALELTSNNTYNYLFIDGDHSYDGIRKDFELYESKLVSGGYLVVDDYDRDTWPGVTKYVDEVIRNSPEYTLIGAGWNTIIFRKK